MKVVLNQDVKGIGKKLQIIEVSEGYARNYLIPKKLASIADNKNINEANTKNDALKFKKKTEMDEAEKNKEIIEKSFVEFKHKVGDGGKLFGSITEKEIAEEVKKKFKLDIDKKKIVINMPIKQLGNYSVDVKLYEGIIAKLKIVVVGMKV
ncbi:MAG: 50S ribosomal protein L9 [Clostridia bacterium]|nr:50S ribosomal protein L9 [Clostridia bacterium]